jgi:hypothetical protein
MTGEKNLCKEPPRNLGARIAEAVLSAVSADQRLARSTRMKCEKDSARFILLSVPGPHSI